MIHVFIVKCLDANFALQDLNLIECKTNYTLNPTHLGVSSNQYNNIM